MKTIAGYTDKISVRPGETIAFKISCEDGPAEYDARLVRLICNDAHPKGPGIIERPVPSSFEGHHRGQRQAIRLGSWALIDRRPVLDRLASFTIHAMIWPTLPGRGRQVLVSTWSPVSMTGFSLALDEAGALSIALGDGREVVRLTTGKPLPVREWALVAASYEAKTGRTVLHQRPLRDDPIAPAMATVNGHLPPGLRIQGDGPILFAAERSGGEEHGLPLVGDHYNGKLDSPRMNSAALDAQELEALQSGGIASDMMGAWDFSRDIGNERVTDISGNGLDGRTINLPARAMKGWNWTGQWHDWRAAPDHYGAIHFHDDDLSDARWETDFEFTLPADLPSGVYAARLENGGDPEHVVFYVRAPRGRPGARVCFLASTATYMAYANYRVMNRSRLYEMFLGQLPELVPADLFLNERPSYGDSLYTVHSDGSGMAISSRLRPIVNMRPNTTLSAFNDDGFLLAWFDAMGEAVDIVTDEDLDREGAAALEGYRCIVTGNHPEYISTTMWNALQGFVDGGGRLMYLGGNGFYWRIAFHAETPGILELRRAEDGTRPWEAESGEYYMSFNGEYGGMWRRVGPAPNRLLGVGFSAQGFDVGSYYRRTEQSRDPRAAFIFDGIGPDERIGDFGIAGNGSAGQEIDRYDRALGSPAHALVVATSENHTDDMMITKEDMPATNYIIGGTENPLVRADMVFFETAGGGAVFSVGSISWSASLPCHGFRNNVSTITRNVLRRFLDPAPFPTAKG